MQDKSQSAINLETDRDSGSRLLLIKQLEQNVTQEINDRDYRSAYMPCHPLNEPLEHWR